MSFHTSLEVGFLIIYTFHVTICIYLLHNLWRKKKLLLHAFRKLLKMWFLKKKKRFFRSIYDGGRVNLNFFFSLQK